MMDKTKIEKLKTAMKRELELRELLKIKKNLF